MTTPNRMVPTKTSSREAITVVRKRNTLRADDDIFEFLLSDETVDEYDDIVSYDGWDLSEFLDNPICLFGHDPNFIIGSWGDVHVDRKRRALVGRFIPAPTGTSQRIDEKVKLVRAGILIACSVGFIPTEQRPRAGSKGTHYIKQRLKECSLVSIPANSAALLQQAREAGIDDRKAKLPKNASVAERKAYRDAVLARARAVMAKTSPSTKKSSDRIGDWWDNLTPEQIAKIELARMKREADQYAFRQVDGFPTPKLFNIFGEPYYRKKNEWGW